MGEVAAISAALQGAFEFSGKYLDYLNSSIIEPAAEKRRQYWDRLNNAFDSLGQSSSVFDDQIQRQQMLMYGLLGLIGLAIVAAILKR